MERQCQCRPRSSIVMIREEKSQILSAIVNLWMWLFLARFRAARKELTLE
jgi:hypothetical protein